MPRGKAPTGGSVTVSEQTVKNLVAQVSELQKEVQGMRIDIVAGGTASSKGGSTGPKKPRRVNALKFYLEDVIDGCKKQALKNDKNLKALNLYMAGKKIATEKFNKLPAKEKAKYEAKATKENAKNGVGAPPKSKTTMSNGTSKGGAKKKAKASIVQEESESDEEVSEESQGSGDEEGSGEEGSGEDESDLDGLLDESDEEEEPPKKKGGRKK